MKLCIECCGLLVWSTLYYTCIF